MKNQIIVQLILLSILFVKADSQTNVGANLPFKPTIVITDESKAVRALRTQSRDLLTTKDFKGLDDLAQKLRSSKDRDANGSWDLDQLYATMLLSEDAPDSRWEDRMATLREWIKINPESITARVALGDVLVTYAWKARGDGTAETVSAGGWRLFEARLQQANEVLDEAKSLNDKCPRWWRVKMTVALGQQWPRSQFDALFNEAIQFEPNYTTYYFSRAYYLMPRWYGAQGEMESDLSKSADRIGGDNGDMVYALTVARIDHERLSTNVFKEFNLSPSRVDRGFGVIEMRFPNSFGAKSERALLAAKGGNRDLAVKYFNQLDGKVDLSTWRSEDQFIRIATWAYQK